MKNYLEDLEFGNIEKKYTDSLNELLNDFADAGIHGEITFDAPENHPRHLASDTVEIRIPNELRFKAYDIIEEKYVFSTNVIILPWEDKPELTGVIYAF